MSMEPPQAVGDPQRSALLVRALQAIGQTQQAPPPSISPQALQAIQQAKTRFNGNAAENSAQPATVNGQPNNFSPLPENSWQGLQQKLGQLGGSVSNAANWMGGLFGLGSSGPNQ